MGAAPLTTEPALALLRPLCAGLSPARIEVVPDGRRTAFVPDRNLIMIARRFLRADTPVAIGALLHEVGHALVTRYNRFAAPKGTSGSLWREALNAAEETRVHQFLRRRLPGVRCYLESLFAMDEPPEPEHLESELIVFLGAVGTCDRFVRLPFLEHFPLAAAAFRRTAKARARYAATLPPDDLIPLPGLAERYADAVLPLLNHAKAGSDDPVEAEIICAAAMAHRIFLAEIWPEMQALAERDQGRIAQALDENDDLGMRAGRDSETLAGAVLARQALRAWADAHDRGSAREIAVSASARPIRPRFPRSHVFCSRDIWRSGSSSWSASDLSAIPVDWSAPNTLRPSLVMPRWPWRCVPPCHAGLGTVLAAIDPDLASTLPA